MTVGINAEARMLVSAMGCALVVSAAAPRALPAQQFPDSWLGHWTGTLVTLSPPDSVRNRIPITLDIAREAGGGAYTWRTVFDADTVRGLRPYRLLTENAAAGQYATDENNGVLLDETFVGGTLTSVFQVQSRMLQSRYTVRGDTLTHELTWWSTAPSRTVTGVGSNAEGGAQIRSFRVQGMQRAVMVRARH